MLLSLDIQGLAIIDNVNIEFTSGFNVVTGETGAGKSVLIKAMSLLLGEKANAELIRHQAPAAIVSGVFRVKLDPEIIEDLDEIGLSIDAQDIKEGICDLIIRRKISDNGRSQAWINEVPVTVTTLRQLTAKLIDVFAQHEHHSLLNPHLHTRFVDQFVKSKDLLQSYQSLYQKCIQKLRELEDICRRYHKMLAEHDYIHFRYEELCKFKPSLVDYKNLLERTDGDADQEKERIALEKTLAILESQDQDLNLIDNLWQTVKILDHTPSLQSFSQSLRCNVESLEEITYSLRNKYDTLEVEPDQVENIQQRLADYQDYFRKFNVQDCEKLVEKMQEFAADLELFENIGHDASQKISEILSMIQTLKGFDKQLKSERLKAAKLLSSQLTEQLKQLAMNQASLQVQWTPIERSFHLDESVNSVQGLERLSEIAEFFCHYASSGSETAELMLCSNPGEPARSLSKIASGGEISRIMLAMKQLIASGVGACILVFDEIDTGISGRVANIVGQKLAELSCKFQVICISHLPQVAVYAGRHLRASKEVGKRTSTQFSVLTTKDREEEIAKLLSGDKITHSSLSNARSIMAEAKSFLKNI